MRLPPLDYILSWLIIPRALAIPPPTSRAFRYGRLDSVRAINSCSSKMLGLPILRYINIEDSEEVLRAIHDLT